MLGAKARFSLNDTDIVRLNNAVSQIGSGAEGIINDHLHRVTGQQMAEGITKYIPVSKKGKRHAKSNKWWTQKNYNLAVEISNSTSGKRSFYYLYYVITGTGTSYKRGKRDFMAKGLEANYSKIVDDLMAELTKYIERGLR